MARLFELDGIRYEFPTEDSITLDEAILVERVAGVGLERLEAGSAMPIGMVKAFVLIAVLRQRPEVSESEASQRIGQLTLSEIRDAMIDEDSAAPLASEPPPENAGSSGSSGGNGNERSARSLDGSRPADTGTPNSATGSPVSARATSVS